MPLFNVLMKKVIPICFHKWPHLNDENVNIPYGMSEYLVTLWWIIIFRESSKIQGSTMKRNSKLFMSSSKKNWNKLGIGFVYEK